MNEFRKRELEGRLKWDCVNKVDVLNGKKIIAYTPDDYDAVDFFMTAGTVFSVGEIKDVHRDYIAYPNFMIDAAKIRNLHEIAKKDSRIPYLVVFFNDGWGVWDISQIDYESRVETRPCTSTTAQNYEKGKKDKEETYFYNNEAIYWKWKE